MRKTVDQFSAIDILRIMKSIYYIVEGTMLFKGDDGVETVLEAGDSVHIAPHSKKCVTNIGTTTAQMLVVLLPEAAK